MKTNELNQKRNNSMSYAEFEKMCAGLTEEDLKMVEGYILSVADYRTAENK